jgi:7-cyano-7-deazaguanine synthase
MSEEDRKPELAIVLLSGGMDSLVTAAVANSQGYELAVLHADYGQRTERRERRAFEEIASFYRVTEERRRVVRLDYLHEIGGSSLTDRSLPVPEGEANRDTIPSTYVPFRNTHLLAISVSWAEVIGARKIFIGVSEPDAPGYPDCRPAYIRAFQELIEVGTRPETEIEIAAPLIRMTKADIVREGQRLGAPFELSWSCYQNEDRPCGRCESCRVRLEAFRQVGVPDPVAYQNTDRTE